jgi:hypothetical protein
LFSGDEDDFSTQNGVREARAIESQLKRKKNPQLAILALNQKDNLTQ